MLGLSYEKIKDKEKRQEKVNQLKEKIQKEINIEKEVRIDLFDELPKDSYGFKKNILIMTALYAIEDFIKDDYCFVTYHNRYEKVGILFYEIHTDFIDLMLQPEFNFVKRILSNLGSLSLSDKHRYEDNSRYYEVGYLLNDYWIRRLISISDEIEYEKKIREIKNEN